MTGEHLVWEGKPVKAPITLDVTCSQCLRIWRYDIPLTTVVNTLLADDGWIFPGEDKQVCTGCRGDAPTDVL